MKEYLGDSVYAEWNGYEIVLTTEYGLASDPSDTIELDEHTCSALARFFDRVKESKAAKSQPVEQSSCSNH